MQLRDAAAAAAAAAALASRNCFVCLLLLLRLGAKGELSLFTAEKLSGGGGGGDIDRDCELIDYVKSRSPDTGSSSVEEEEEELDSR